MNRRGGSTPIYKGCADSHCNESSLGVYSHLQELQLFIEGIIPLNE